MHCVSNSFSFAPHAPLQVSPCLMALFFGHSFSQVTNLQKMFCFTKPCRLLQGQWMEHTLEIPNVEKQWEEMRDFEAQRTASSRATAGHQILWELVYVHLTKQSLSSSLFKKEKKACGKGVRRDGNVISLKIDDVLFYDVHVVSVAWFLPTGLHAAPLAGKWVHTFRVSSEGAAQGSWKKDALPRLQHDWLVRMCPSQHEVNLLPYPCLFCMHLRLNCIKGGGIHLCIMRKGIFFFQMYFSFRS